MTSAPVRDPIAIKTFGVPVVHSTINVASGRGRPTLRLLKEQ